MTAVLASAPQRREALWTNPYVEAFAAFLWFFTTAYRYNHDTEVLYALCGYFVVGAYLHRDKVGPLLLRGWPILLLPPWMMMSTFWSAVPTETFKTALQEVLSVLICFYVAARISPQTFIVSLMAALTFYEVLGIPMLIHGDLADVSGLLGEKNFYAYRMSILSFAAVAVCLDSTYKRYIRLAAAPIAAIAFLVPFRAHSATSMVAGSIGFALVVGCAWVWAPARGSRALIVSLAVAAVAAVMLILAQNPNFSFQSAVLGALGKDSTLTGRQELWDYAGKLIKERPLLGMGPGSFWLPWRPDAQELLETHFKPRGSAWLFHNSYIEITVYLGYIGLTLGLIGWVWSFFTNISNMLRHASVATAFFAAISVVALARSYVESDLWQPFDYGQMIIWIGALYSWRAAPVRTFLTPAAKAAAP